MDEKKKIVFDYCFEKAEVFSGSLGTLSFTYGYPIVKDSTVEIDEIESVALNIKSNEFRSTLEGYVINYLEQKYPDMLILSKDDYAFSILKVDERKLSKRWKRNFRRHKLNLFLKKVRDMIVTDKVRFVFKYIFKHKQLLKEARDRRIDHFFGLDWHNVLSRVGDVEPVERKTRVKGRRKPVNL
jgi:hypothetical protein